MLPAVERPSTWKPAAPATPRGTPPAAAPIAPEVAPAPVEAPAVVMPANQTGLDELMEPDVAPVPTQPARARLDGFKEWCGQGDNGLILGAALVGLLLLLVVFAA